MPGKPIVVVHGCCKGVKRSEEVRAESMNAALAVGADRSLVRSSYYACLLDRAVNAQGHTTTMPEGCANLEPQVEDVPHDDDGWNSAIAERVADPSNASNVLALANQGIVPMSAADLSAITPANIGVLGLWIGSWFVEFHVFVSTGHQPQGRDAVWEAIGGDFAELKGGDYVLVTHSLGSIITASLLQTEKIPHPAAYVTVGSQLGWSSLQLLFGLRPFHLGGHWVNVIDTDDPAAGFFTGVRTPAGMGYTADNYRDLWVTNVNADNHHDFVGYMQTAEAVREVGALI